MACGASRVRCLDLSSSQKSEWLSIKSFDTCFALTIRPDTEDTMAAIANTVFAGAALGAPGSRVARRGAVRRGPLPLRALAKETTEREGPVSAFTKAAKNLGVGLMAATIVFVPGANAMPTEVISDLASLAANPVQNARALLRNALPIDNKQIREVQRRIESISDDLRVPGVRFTGVESSVNASSKIVTSDAAKILAAVAPEKLEDGKQALALLTQELEDFKVVVRASHVPRSTSAIARTPTDISFFTTRWRRRTSRRFRFRSSGFCRWWGGWRKTWLLGFRFKFPRRMMKARC